jgi:low affinity Fe/Cu permease
MRVKHPSDRDGGRGGFEKFAEHASNFTASRVFSGLCVLLVLAFVAVHAFSLPLTAQLAAGDAMTAVTLLLLALLKNSERRAEYAIQRKLDALATALLEDKEGKDHDARTALEEAIRTEDDV